MESLLVLIQSCKKKLKNCFTKNIKGNKDNIKQHLQLHLCKEIFPPNEKFSRDTN